MITPRFLLPVLASAVVSTGVLSGPIAAADVGPGTPSSSGSRTPNGAPPVMEVVDPGLAVEDGRQTDLPWASSLDHAPQTAPPAPPATAAPAPTTGSIHVVQRGEHFWSIAELVLSDRGLPTPSDRDVADYWGRLVETNRDKLVDPDNPDLIFPGQELRIP